MEASITTICGTCSKPRRSQAPLAHEAGDVGIADATNPCKTPASWQWRQLRLGLIRFSATPDQPQASPAR